MSLQQRVPPLQHVASRACVCCGGSADAFCARCGVTPYCSLRCQIKDWKGRHKSVCHNLARLTNEKSARSAVEDVQPMPQIPTAAPLRRPHFHKEDVPRADDDAASKVSDKSIQTRRFNSGPRTPSQRLNYNGSGNSARDPGAGPSPRDTAANNTRNTGAGNIARDSNAGNDQQRSTRSTLNKSFQRYEPAAEAPQTSAPTAPKVSPVKQELKVEKATTPVVAARALISQVNGRAKPDTPAVKPATLSDVTPSRKLVPKNYLVELLSVGDVALISVEANSRDCRTTRGNFVCISLHERFEADYTALCEDYIIDCDADSEQLKLVPGEPCSYYNPEDGGWYRGRCLNASTVALMDSCKIVSIQSTDKIRKLPAKYEQTPEFCCVLESSSVQIGDNLKCSIVSKAADGLKVTMEHVESGAAAGDAVLMRWMPTVDYLPAKPVIPEVSRPLLCSRSRVVLVEARSLQRAFVRGAGAALQRDYDDVLQSALLAGRKASPLKEPPVKGQTVIAKFSDGIHYRALCKRTNVEKNKYMLEYIEYGNTQVTGLEDIYPCPQNLDLTVVPTQVSMVKLGPEEGELTPPALQYVEKIKEEEMILTLPNGESSAPSGSEVILKLAKNGEHVNKKIQEMCTPDWKKFEQKGGDVVDVAAVMYRDLEYTAFPAGPALLEILDINTIKGGVISGYVAGDKNADYVFTHITEKMAEYCNSELGREPYLPKYEELCIAQCPPYPQWFRAVMVEQVPGAVEARVCYLDYGNVDLVPVALLRKMLPEFVRGVPAVVSTLEIKDCPKDVTDDMVLKAAEYMKLNEDGRGQLNVRNSVMKEPGLYVIDAPELIKVMTQ